MGKSTLLFRALIGAFLLWVTPPVAAQANFPSTTVPARPQPGEIALLPDAPDREIWFVNERQFQVRNVTRPTLTPFPALGRPTGTAVIIAPGGGFLGLAIEKEGWEIARWFANRGVTAFVLKYRTMPTPTDQAVFARDLGRMIRGEATRDETGFGPPPDTPADALADGLAALRHVRAHAADYGINPERVGFMGFSAGGFLTRTVVASAGTDMPNFVAPIYPSMAPMAVPANAPPMFVAIAADDFLLARETGFPLIADYRTAGRSIEFHLLSNGGHGFGPGLADTASEDWMSMLQRWLTVQGFMEAQ